MLINDDCLFLVMSVRYYILSFDRSIVCIKFLFTSGIQIHMRNETQHISLTSSLSLSLSHGLQSLDLSLSIVILCLVNRVPQKSPLSTRSSACLADCHLDTLTASLVGYSSIFWTCFTWSNNIHCIMNVKRQIYAFKMCWQRMSRVSRTETRTSTATIEEAKIQKRLPVLVR